MTRVVASCVLALALAGSGQPSRPAVSAPVPRHVLAAELTSESWRLVELDARTLRRASRRSLSLPGFVTGVKPSPDGRLLALTLDAVGGPTRVLVVDVRRLRPLGGTALAREGTLLTVAWTNARELVALAAWPQPRAWTFDVRGHVRATHTFRGTLIATAAAGSRIVGLLGPRHGIGRARLLVLERGGRVRTAAAGVDAGVETRGSMRQVAPGLAVDAAGRRAVVVPPGERAVAFDLATLEFEAHALRSRVSGLGRLLGWLEATAEAKTIPGSERRAVWVGAHAVAVTGSDGRARRNGSVRSTTTPLAFVDTRDWSLRTVGERAGTLASVGELVLAYGGGWAPDHAAKRHGLTAFGPDGNRLFRVLADRYVQDVVIAGRYAYAVDSSGRRFAVVDLARGRVVARPRTQSATVILGAARGR